NAMPFPTESSATALVINTTASGTFTLNLKDVNQVPALYDIWLVDQHTKTSTNLRKNSTYTFTVDKTDTTTYGAKRFALLIQQNPAYAYKLVSFNANKANNGVKVDWKSSNEQNYTGFAVERSNDSGKTFVAIDSIASNGQGSYNFTDQSPVSGQNQYRLKQRDISGSISYSAVVTIQYSNQSNNLVKSNISVYPNPAVSTINVTVPNMIGEAATYSIQVSNSFGLMIKQATSTQPTYQADISGLTPGTYIVKVFNKKDNSLVGNSKFVKM
ncbi:MAG: T9SS type A sorting domain-containing protein, partial [Mucilaginibacter sp.]